MKDYSAVAPEPRLMAAARDREVLFFKQIGRINWFYFKSFNIPGLIFSRVLQSPDRAYEAHLMRGRGLQSDP